MNNHNTFTFQNRMTNKIKYIEAYNLQEANNKLKELYPHNYNDFILVGSIEDI